MYQGLPSLEEYILVSQDSVRIERRHRQNRDQWLLDAAPCRDGQLPLLSLDLEIPLAEIYLDVEFEASRRVVSLPWSARPAQQHPDRLPRRHQPRATR